MTKTIEPFSEWAPVAAIPFGDPVGRITTCQCEYAASIQISKAVHGDILDGISKSKSKI